MKSKKLVRGIIILILLSIFFIRIPILSFEFSDTTYYSTEKEFNLSWIHSVEKEEWIEHYELEGKKIVLESTKFKTFGAGVPSDSEEVELVDGFVHMKINQSYQELNLTISENVKSTIYLGDKEFKLYEYGETYDTVQIKVKKLFIWQYWREDYL